LIEEKLKTETVMLPGMTRYSYDFAMKLVEQTLKQVRLSVAGVEEVRLCPLVVYRKIAKQR
jgi:hypothetical protein